MGLMNLFKNLLKEAWNEAAKNAGIKIGSSSAAAKKKDTAVKKDSTVKKDTGGKKDTASALNASSGASGSDFLMPDPDAGEAEAKSYFAKGMEFYNKKDYDNAIGCFSNAICYRKDANYYIWRGKTYARLGETWNGQKDFLTANKIDPNNKDEEFVDFIAWWFEIRNRPSPSRSTSSSRSSSSTSSSSSEPSRKITEVEQESSTSSRSPLVRVYCSDGNRFTLDSAVLVSYNSDSVTVKIPFGHRGYVVKESDCTEKKVYNALGSEI